MNSNIFKQKIKSRSRDYLQWLRQQPTVAIPSLSQILSHDFQFTERFRYLNFHPNIMDQAKDLLTGRVDRQYNDSSPDIAIHDYVGRTPQIQSGKANLPTGWQGSLSSLIAGNGLRATNQRILLGILSS